MGNPLKKVLPWIDPVGNAATKVLGINDGLGAKPAAPPPAYDPSKNPGVALQSAPSGGPPGAGGPSSSLFSAPGGGAPSGYAPNPWQAGGSMGNRVATPGAP